MPICASHYIFKHILILLRVNTICYHVQYAKVQCTGSSKKKKILEVFDKKSQATNQTQLPADHLSVST